MLFILFALLIIGFVISYVTTHRNILSAWVLAHVMYILSVLILLINYDSLKGDITVGTCFIIIGSLAFIGAGELFVRGFFFKKKVKYYYPSRAELYPIIIKKKVYIGSLILMTALALYDYYKFNIIGSYLGGSDIATKYLLMRTMVVGDANGSEYDLPAVPLDLPMAYLEFFGRILAYFYIYIYLYHKTFRIKNLYRPNWMNLIPIVLYVPICFFTTSRSIFINLIETFGVIYFIMLKQSRRQWNSSSSNFKIIKKGIVLLAVFALIFSYVGTFKGSDVAGDASGTAVSYASGGIYGLDEYMRGRYGKESAYFGQNTFSKVYVILNKLGFNFEKPIYHNDAFVWGKHGEISNIAASPFNFMIDFPLPIVMIIYFILGMIYSFFMNSIKFGRFKVLDFNGYVITAMLYYSVFVITITEDFHSNIGSAFVYYIICVYIIKYYFITKPLKRKQMLADNL